VARAQPLADVPPRAPRKPASPVLCRSAGVMAECGGGACVSVALPPRVVHGAEASGANAYRAAASVDGASELVHGSAPSGERKEAP
jgi:hypothetical protein